MTRALAAALLVTLWLGAALLAVAVVAPAAFAVLPTRAMAGTMVGGVLPTVFIGAACTPVLALSIYAPARRVALAVVPTVVAVVAAGLALLVVDPRIAALREVAVIPIDQLAPADPRRALFGVLHAVSVALLGVAMLANAALLAALVRATAKTAPHSGGTP